MIQLAFSPQWFSGIDCIFDTLAVIVTLLLAAYGFKIYKFSKEPRYQYFSLAFLSIAFGFLAKIFTNFTLYNKILEQHTVGLYNLFFNAVSSVIPFYQAGLLMYRFLILAGLLGLFFIINKKSSVLQTLISLYMAAITVLFSAHRYFVFHFTTAAILAAIVYILYKNHANRRTEATLLTTASFFTLLLSQIVFIFIVLNKYTYVVAEIAQLAGFALLLYSYILVSKK